MRIEGWTGMRSICALAMRMVSFHKKKTKNHDGFPWQAHSGKEGKTTISTR